MAHTVTTDVLRVDGVALGAVVTRRTRAQYTNFATWTPQPDPTWSHIDDAGHHHRWGRRGNTLRWPGVRVTNVSDGDAYVCVLCGADLEPDMFVPALPLRVPVPRHSTIEVTIDDADVIAHLADFLEPHLPLTIESPFGAERVGLGHLSHWRTRVDPDGVAVDAVIVITDPVDD